MQVVDVDSILHRRTAEFIHGPVGKPGLHAAAGHPDGESVVVVVATLLALGGGRPAEFAALSVGQMMNH